MTDNAASWDDVPLSPFNKALVETDAEDTIDRGDPCYLCGREQSEVLIWTPGRALDRRLNLGGSRHLFRPLPLCSRCMADPDWPDRVEQVHNRMLDLDDATRAAGWELLVHGHSAHLVTPDRVAVPLDPDLVLAYAHPIGRPDVMLGIDAVGTLAVVAPDGEDEPEPPACLINAAAAIREAHARRTPQVQEEG